MNKSLKKRFAASLLFAVAASFAHAQGNSFSLVDAYQRARKFDPQFQSALAERDANVISSKIAGSALYPELSVSHSQLETENSTRSTVTLSQPIFNMDRYATFREATPRAALADATYSTREQELALKLFKAVEELVRARESLQLNKAKIDAFDLQYKAAKRTYELGTGTITDMRDAQVKVDQARAADLTLRARQAAAERALAAITGDMPASGAYGLTAKKPVVALQPVDDYLAQAVGSNPQLLVARQKERIAELGVTRARGAWLPTVAAAATRTKTSTTDNNYVGISLSFPLRAGTAYETSNARANAARASEATRDLELKTRLEVQRLRELVDAGRGEVEIRLESIRSAELSVEANEKSFGGGIRTRLDILNSIQTLYQTKEDHLNAMLTLGENLLSLYLQLALPIPEALERVQALLFSAA